MSRRIYFDSVLVFWEPFHPLVCTSVLNAVELSVDGWHVHEWTYEGRNGLQGVVLTWVLSRGTFISQ